VNGGRSKRCEVKRVRKGEGFTLLEMLIVLAVIAAVLTAITPVAVRTLRKAKATQVALNLRTLQVAMLECYIVETPNSTIDIDDLYSGHYVSNKPEGYVINWATFTTGVAKAFLVYTSEDVELEFVEDVLPQAVFVSTFTDVDGAFAPSSMVISEEPQSGYYPALNVLIPRM